MRSQKLSLLFIAGCFLLLPHTGTAAEKPTSRQQTVEALMEWISINESLLGHTDRSQFVLEEVLEAQDYKLESIVKFVSEQIQYQACPGLMRGAEGTLTTRAGNALDQAVLLAKLLKDAGFDARIAETQISEDQSCLLLHEMSQTVAMPPALLPVAMDAFKRQAKIIENYIPSSQPGADADPLGIPEMHEKATALDSSLLKAVQDAQFGLSTKAIPEEMVK